VISVVVPVRDGAGVLAGQLGALAAQEVPEPWEVVIADNGSRDRLSEVVAARRASVPGPRVVDASGRSGVNHARNAGARAARGDRILFCDAVAWPQGGPGVGPSGRLCAPVLALGARPGPVGAQRRPPGRSHRRQRRAADLLPVTAAHLADGGRV
jgi:glycosyltransferase involved in cell wall biosynthesis